MSLPICPLGCTSNLPEFDFNLCNPTLNAGQIAKIFFTTVGNPMIDWSSAAEWASRIDNNSTGASSIRTLIGIGDMPAPTTTDKEISLGRKVFGKRSFVVNFRVDESSAITHDAFRQMQCTNGNYLVWLETRDHLLWGDNSGIEAAIKVDQVIPEAYSDYVTYQITITWDAQFMPKREASPITDTTGDQF